MASDCRTGLSVHRSPDGGRAQSISLALARKRTISSEGYQLGPLHAAAIRNINEAVTWIYHKVLSMCDLL